MPRWPNTTTKEKFEDKYIPDPNSGCWVWIACCSRGGGGREYGSMKMDGRMQRAHRISWQLYKGEITKGLHVLHKCDNTYCVNPNHLFLGTHKDNIRDMFAKGRGRPNKFKLGEECISSKLNKKQVAEIREIYSKGGASRGELAKKYFISRSQIGRIVNYENWNIN